MLVHKICRIALIFAFLLVPFSQIATADYWIPYRTGICSEQDEYAEFRLSGTWSGTTFDDNNRRIPELPLSSIWARRGVEHSWRCDLPEGKTITVRYTLIRKDLLATIWVNQVRFPTINFHLWNKQYEDAFDPVARKHVFFPSIVLDANGLKVCRTDTGCHEVSWAEMPKEKDPAYKPGWLFGTAPRLRVSPMRIVSGGENLVCQRLVEALSINHLSNLSYRLFHEDSPKALWLSKSSEVYGMLKRGLHSFDIDNDGIKERVYTTQTSAGNVAQDYYVVIEGEAIPEATKLYLDKPQHYMSYVEKFPNEAGTTLVSFDDFEQTVTFPIESNGKNYIYVRAHNPEAKQSQEGRDAVTHAVYEYKQSGKLETVCEFCAPSICYDE